MKPIESPWNTTPFWVVRAPSSLIKDHNDIFGPGVVNLLAAVIFQYGNGRADIRVADSNAGRIDSCAAVNRACDLIERIGRSVAAKPETAQRLETH